MISFAYQLDTSGIVIWDGNLDGNCPHCIGQWDYLLEIFLVDLVHFPWEAPVHCGDIIPLAGCPQLLRSRESSREQTSNQANKIVCICFFLLITVDLHDWQSQASDNVVFL